LGIVDCMDLLACVLREVASGVDGEAGLRQWTSLIEKGSKFLGEELIKVAGNDTCFAFKDFEDRSVMDLIQELCRTGGCHRVVLSDEKGMLSNIISQSDVVRYIAKNPDLAGKLLGSTVEELNYTDESKKAVVAFPADCSALDAFKTMYREKVSSVALVDTEGKLAGNLSASDLRGMTPSSFAVLSKSCRAFKAYQGAAHTEPCFVFPDDTLKKVLETFLATKTHRLYILAYGGPDKGKPVGIVTLTDVLRTISLMDPRDYKSELPHRHSMQAAHLHYLDENLKNLCDEVMGPAGQAFTTKSA